MKTSVLALVGALTLFAAEAKENIAFVSAHPDDSYAFGGVVQLLTPKYDVHILDFTYGERGCGEEKFRSGWTKAKRTDEETKACAFLGLGLKWVGEIDGEAMACPRAVWTLVEMFRELKPKAVFIHWPLDKHPDHVQASAAAQKALRILGYPCEIYLFEEYFIPKHRQTMHWHPLYSVDVSAVAERKVAFLRHYECQNEGDEMVQNDIFEMRERGRERVPACAYAETFTTYDGEYVKGGVLEELKETVRIGEKK